MTREELLKSYILKQYRTVKDFSVAIGLPYTTIDGILRRGVMNTRVENMIRVCQFLGISLDALVAGRIEPYSDRPSFSIDDVSALEKYHNLPASDKETVDFVLNRHAQRAEAFSESPSVYSVLLHLFFIFVKFAKRKSPPGRSLTGYK